MKSSIGIVVREVLTLVENDGWRHVKTRGSHRQYKHPTKLGSEEDHEKIMRTGASLEEIEHNIKEAIELHLEGMMEDGEPIPKPKTAVSYVELQVA